jgi:hypothetical protein
MVVSSLSAWGEQYTEHDLVLVDRDCGHGVKVVYHCATCDRERPQPHPHRGRLTPPAAPTPRLYSTATTPP